MENEYPFLKCKTRPFAMLVRLCWESRQKRSHMLSSITHQKFISWLAKVHQSPGNPLQGNGSPLWTQNLSLHPLLTSVSIFDATISNRRVECWQWMLSPLSDTMTSHISLAKESHVTVFNLYRTEECNPAGNPEAEESKTLVSSAEAHPHTS